MLRSFVDTPKKNDGGVNYYQHFHKDFIRPYGLAHTEKSFVDSTLAKRLETINCEFMLRPHIGVSEFMKTVTENCKYITGNLEIFDVEAIKKFLHKVESIMESLQIVNQKEKSGSDKTFKYIFNIYIYIYVYIYIYMSMYIYKDR